jgi:cell filamentation protein
VIVDSGDPYVYPGTEVLINMEDIRDADELEQVERIMTAQRLREGLPNLALTPEGYRSLHRHLFQDVYAWAGQDRIVDIAKGNSYFCRADFIGKELAKRFEAIRAENGLKGLSAEQFAERAAEHVSELNAIHPFREGNGRVQRAFLVVLGRQAGHRIEMQRIEPSAWNEASRVGFRTLDYKEMRRVIAGALVEPLEQQRRQ